MIDTTVKAITTTKEDIRQSIRDPNISWLLDTSACEQCEAFLVLHYARDARAIDEQRWRYEAGQLLVILAAMEGESECDTLEALCAIGARSVDARGNNAKKRWKRAGEARERPVTNSRHYQRGGHLARMQQRLATELHALIARPDRLQVALEKNGAMAIAKYL